jgi:NAD(P)-dependent dehydrogenase (short-subunit alcohol dehydrogenase family)
MELQGKVALVTGGGTGLGKEISLQLAREGVDIALAYTRSVADAEATVAEIRGLGRRAIAVKADVSQAAEVEALVETVVRELGGLDVLINNAGYTQFIEFSDLEGVTEEAWDRIMDVNVKGAFLVSRAAAPSLRKSGVGKIVNITSVSAVKAGGSSIPYSVSKAAETMLTKCLALALAPEIAVNAVAPGLMDTRWGRLWGDAAFARSEKAAPLGHIATLKDITDAAVFLVKNDSMTGQSIVVDGGGYMH